MQTSEYFAFLVNEIHSVIAATVDDNGKPVTCAIDIMDYDESCLYFLTAKGKGFYKRLKNQEYIAFTGMKGNDTMSRIAVSVNGKVREIGSDKVHYSSKLNNNKKHFFKCFAHIKCDKFVHKNHMSCAADR